MLVCRLSAFSNIFSSETTGLIEVRFHVESPWDGLEVKILDTLQKNFRICISLQPRTTSMTKHINGPWDILS